MSYRETEVKLRLKDAPALPAQLESLGAKVETERHFEDNFVLDTMERKLRKTGKLLRLRVTGNKAGLFTYKGEGRISDGVKDREEVECTISHPDHFLRILSELGYTVSFRYQKYRTVFRIGGVELEFCFDETPIGDFLEMEGDVEQIHIYAEKLGFSRTQYITESYASLYFQWCNENKTHPSNMTFP